MANIKKITSFTSHTTAEGERLSYTYSEIDSDGNLVKSNERRTCIVMDQGLLQNIKNINEFLTQREGSID